MKRSSVIKISLTLILFIVIYFSYSYYQHNAFATSTTTQSKIVSKDREFDDQWIMIEDGKRIKVDDLSLWTLIEENETYALNYGWIKKTNTYKLKKIVPWDYPGQW